MKTIISLGGGGTNGIFEIGALSVLNEKDVLKDVSGYTGTSIGGINAMLLSKYHDNFNEVIKIWNNIKKNTDIYNGKVDIFGFMKIFFKMKSVLNQQGLYKILAEQFRGMKLRDFKIPVCITATNLSKMRAEIFYPQDNKLFDAEVMAKITSSINVLFQFQMYHGCMFTDGGLLNNNPVLTAINMGADRVIAIGTAPLKPEPLKLKQDGMGCAEGTLKTLLQGYTENMVNEIKNHYPDKKILYLYPAADLGNALEVSNMQQKFNAGRECALKYWTDEKIKDFYS